MIHAEHFIYAHKTGIIKSPGVDQLLTRKSLRHLCTLNGNSVIQTWLPESVVAITFLRHDKDEYGREIIHNHTILLTVPDYFKLHPPTMFQKYFVTHIMHPPPRVLAPLRISEPKWNVLNVEAKTDTKMKMLLTTDTRFWYVENVDIENLMIDEEQKWDSTFVFVLTSVEIVYLWR